MALPAGAFAQQMPSVLALQPGMSYASAEKILLAIQPKLDQQYGFAVNPISGETQFKQYVEATSTNAEGNTTIWLRFSLLDNDLESVNYNKSYSNPKDFPAVADVTGTLIGKFGSYSMVAFHTLVWQYDHTGHKLGGGNIAFASSPQNPHCTSSDYMAEEGNPNAELSQFGIGVLNEMYSACDVVYQFIPTSNDNISMSSFEEDLLSYGALEKEANALSIAFQKANALKVQQEQNQAATNKPSL